MKKLSLFIVVLMVASIVLSACGPAATTAPTQAVVVTDAPPAPTEKPYKVGFVTDTGGIDDQSFNTTQWNGVLRAQEQLGVKGQFIQSDEATQYTPNLTEFASQGYDLVIAAGFFLGGDLAKVAAQYPDVKFSIVDYSYPESRIVAMSFCEPRSWTRVLSS